MADLAGAVGPTIMTASGRYFPLLSPKPADVSIFDIAAALAKLCRFNGHTHTFYSVAQHSVMVSHLVPEEDALAGLLHDAAEAYVGDVTRPLKPLLPEYGSIEVRILSAVFKRFGLETAIPASVQAADMVALATERRDVLRWDGSVWPCLEGVEPAKSHIVPLPPAEAEVRFLWRFRHLTGRAL